VRFNQEHLDKYYPLMPAGEEPPETGPDGRRQIVRMWRTQHGPATVLWHMRRPQWALRARLIGRSLVDRLIGAPRADTQNVAKGWRRPSEGEHLWIYGSIDIQLDDVTFEDGQQPAYKPPERTDRPDLELDLANDAEFLTELRDDSFASAVNRALCNAELQKAGSDEWRSFGDDDAARIVAELRGLGESYEDYLHHEEGVPGSIFVHRLILLDLEIRNARPRAVKPAAKAYLSELADRKMPLIKAAPTELHMLEERVAQIWRNHALYDRIEAHFNRLGWRYQTLEELHEGRLLARRQQLKRRVDLLRMVRACETRPSGQKEAWAEKVRLKDSVPFQTEELPELSIEELEAAAGCRASRARTCNLGTNYRI
jgi:hypothetical protein